MNIDVLTKLLLAIFFSFNFFIIPLLSGIISLISILTLKNKLKKSGKCYFVLRKNDSRISHKKLLVFGIAILTCSIFLVFLSGEWLYLAISLTIIIWQGSEIIMANLYDKYNGMYENGIINFGIIPWKEIYSFKINEKNIFGYYRKSNLFKFKNFEFKDIENIDEIRELFKINKIREGQDDI